MERMRALSVVVVLLVAACGDGADSGACRDGETRACYRGVPGTEGVGVCAAGTQTCSGGAWQDACLGDVTPFVEKCNGLDDDCNGIVDDVEHAGEACNGSNGCMGQRACVGETLSCIAERENACGLCGGPDITGLGGECVANGCTGSLVCTADEMGTECAAPVQNACGVCGGAAVSGLGDVCMATAGCAGRLACDTAGTAAVCDCSVNICNDNGTIRPVRSPETGDLVITEIMPSPSKVSDTVGEWFEIEVLTDIDLNNLLLDRAGDSSQPVPINAYDCMRVTAGSYVVFAKSADPTVNGSLPTVAATFNFSLVTGSTASPGDVRILVGDTVIDAVTWTSSRSGKALQLDPDFTDPLSNDQTSNFCDATTAYGLGDLGSPGAANNQCAIQPPAGQCDDGGTYRAIVKPGATDLVITEVMPNPKVEPGQEWFEVTNVGAGSFDLNGLGLDRANDTASPNVINATACEPLAPGAFALFAHSSDPATNAMLPAPDATFSFSMVNTTGDVRVVDPTTCSGSPLVCTTIYDSVTYATSTDGVSSQVKPGFFTTTGNDDPANYCPAITTYGDGTNQGTPRAANVCN